LDETAEKKTLIAESFQKLNSTSSGLTSSEVKKRLEQYGPNLIDEEKESLYHKIFKYFWGPIPWMIEVAAILSLLVHHIPDFIFISLLLIFNACVAFIQEYQAGNAIEALKKKLALKSRVLRDSQWQEIEAAELVLGDMIRIRLGDIVPADSLLVEGDYLSIDQSALTGESFSVTKEVGDTVFSGSVVQKGEMAALVTATGKETFFGKTVKLAAGAQPVSHFQKAVLQIGDFLIYLSLFLVFILFVVQLSRGDSFLELLKFALILTVASIPVAMPAVLSVTMAVGAMLLSKMKAIVTRLQFIEEMAGIDTLLCDKTGTLTQNKLTIGDPVLAGDTTFDKIIRAAALASRAEDLDAIDLTILNW
jgi:H+-transporting ATPase